jgi:hypothetical protein
MRTTRKCIPGLRQISFLAALLVPFSLCAPLFAQNAPLAERLSPNTIFYVEWRGSASLTDAEKKNHALQLIEDPALAPAWLALASSMQKGLTKQAATAPTPKLADVISLATNSALFGVAENPDYAKPAGKKPAPVGIFFVYDAKGKKEVIENLKSLHKDATKTGHTITHYEFAGTTIEEDATAAEHDYSAEAGGYFLFSTLKSEIEDLVTRFHGDTKPAACVADLPEYKETRKFIGTDVAFEIFGRMPNFTKWIPDDPKTQPIVKSLEKLHLDRIHAFAVGTSFAGEAMVWKGAFLGDMSTGSLFDVVGDSGTDFQMMPLLAMNSNFSSHRMNWAAFYHVLRASVDGNLTPQQAAMLGAGEGMAQGYLGMSIPDALDLFTGELCTTTAVVPDGTTQQIFASTIKKPQDVLRMLRAVLGSKIVAEDAVGGTTYLDISYPYKDPITGTQRRSFYYVAVGPNALAAGKRKANVKATIEALNAGSTKMPATGLLADKEYLELRHKLPEKLSGFGAADYSVFPVDKWIASFIDQMSNQPKQSKDTPPTDLTWLKPITSAVITSHIHVAVSGTWKDSNGIYFASYLQ